MACEIKQIHVNGKTTFNLSLSSKNQPLFKQIDNEWMAYSFKGTALSLRVSVIHLIALDNI